MILIKVSGEMVSETREFVDIIEEALAAKGKRALIATYDEMKGSSRSGFDCVVVERPLTELTSKDPKKFDFLIGLTEAAAYEIAQDHGFIVRIWTRNGHHVGTGKGLVNGRVNLSVDHNIVTGWHIG